MAMRKTVSFGKKKKEKQEVFMMELLFFVQLLERGNFKREKRQKRCMCENTLGSYMDEGVELINVKFELNYYYIFIIKIICL